ncbi:somatomedin-B and thrombospondin type-1 domain-containing protein [Brienomyrus brachyistius]|uniref:somatomedin-B and thrombospondin type-1 domain-containing protein n=1 Tax=Brienomyrus brachyistius TaxID=42636 RepID=UPI0020B34151|nr:somatomedin-B and thrombospondin type-1 domain-containing protein [Brienomyrus brachyistius]
MGASGRCLCMVLLILAVSGGFFIPAEAGCADRSSPTCCTGRNNECGDFSKQRSVCYCDTYCQKTGDCCEDYGRVCHISAIDCVLSPWGQWTECNALCGTGSMERTRQVTVPPRNGGTPCPDLRQRRGCFGKSELCRSSEEVARILPDSFKRNFKDPWRRPHMLMKEIKHSYCVWLRISQASAACRRVSWAAQLVTERSVCAECQGDAMDATGRCVGDGLEATRTFWMAVTVPGCHGSWVRMASPWGCRCPQHSMLFV